MLGDLGNYTVAQGAQSKHIRSNMYTFTVAKLSFVGLKPQVHNTYYNRNRLQASYNSMYTNQST